MKNSAPHTWSRLYVSHTLEEGHSFVLDIKQSHYLTQVMRIREGEPIRIFNGTDGEWRGTLSDIPRSKKRPATMNVENLLREQKTEPDVWLCAAPIKRHYYDFEIMKATELGASVIQPVMTERTQSKDVNIERLKSIVIEAAEQSERLTLPEVREPILLKDLLSNWKEERLAVLCAEHGQAEPIAKALTLPLAQSQKTAAIFSGPEGGYTSEELENIARLPKVLSVRLGPRILRADTAAIAALTCWQAMCGDWDETEMHDRPI